MFSKVFSEILQNKGLSGYRVSKDTGISAGLISDYKNGVKEPTKDNLIKLSNYLGAPVEVLLGQKENRPPISERSKLILKEVENLSESEAEAVLKQIEIIKSLRN